MIISLIAAMTPSGVIGKDNALPWRLPEDLKNFKRVTLGKPIIMGRKTFESMNSKPLPGRHNIILTHAQDFEAPGCTVVHSVEEALHAAGNVEEVVVIGGAKVYEEFLPIATRFYLTRVHHEYDGDTYFPNVNWGQWKVIEESRRESFTMVTMER